MRIWYEYRSVIYLDKTPLVLLSSFHFCEDRKFFDSKCRARFWKVEGPINFKQFMVEAEKTRKYSL